MNEYDPIETCPYDPVHRIMRSRMQYHLSKCARNFPTAKKKQCPYDARHIINEIEFNYHINVCPQRESVMRYKIVENKEHTQIKILPIDPTPVVAVADENWEEDGQVNTYDPLKHTENRPVIRTLAGAQPAERKRYQKQERRRISQLEDAQNVQVIQVTPISPNDFIRKVSEIAPSLVKSTIPEQASAEAEEEYKPLRRPKKLPLDTSKLSDFSTTINESTIMNQTQHSIVHNDSLQSAKQEKSSKKENTAPQSEGPSYANALKREQNLNSSIASDYDVIIESVKFDNKLNNTIDESLTQVTKTVQELAIGDEGHKEQTKSLDKTLESLKQTDKSNSAVSNEVKSNRNIFATERRSLRCAANFSNLKN